MAAGLEEALAQGVKDGKVPHAIVFATNKDGSFQYSHAVGFQNYGTDDSSPIQKDSLLMLASQSKLLTAISALKLVELGYIGLEDDVSPHIPELGKKQILTGFDEKDGKPILVDRKNPITIRHLATHTSGDGYGFDPNSIKFELSQGRANPIESIKSTIVERYNLPLSSEPGTSWMYSPGLDWIGLLIHRLTGLTLDEFEKKYLWESLGIKGITFWPDEEWKKSKLAQLVVRAPDGGLVPNESPHINTYSKDCFGGHGVYAQMGDYLKVQQSLLANDGKLLKPESVEELFRPNISEGSQAALDFFMQGFSGMLPGEFDSTKKHSYAIGGLVFMEDDVGRRRKGTLSWGGLFNPFWTIDREAGLAFTFGTQVLPPGDPGCKEMEGVAEKAVYKIAGLA